MCVFVCVCVCVCVRVFACVCVCLCVYRRQQRAAEPAVQGEVLGHGHVFALQLEHGADEGVDGVWVFVALEVLVDLIRKPLAHSSVVEHVVGPRVQRDGLDLGLAETETRLPLHNHRLHTLELHEFAEVCKCQKRPSIDQVYGKRTTITGIPQFVQLPFVMLGLAPVFGGAGRWVGLCGHDLPLLPRRSFYAVIAGCELGIAVGHIDRKSVNSTATVNSNP